MMAPDAKVGLTQQPHLNRAATLADGFQHAGVKRQGKAVMAIAHPGCFQIAPQDIGGALCQQPAAGVHTNAQRHRRPIGRRHPALQ